MNAVQQLVEARRELEEELRGEVARLLQRFRRDTGCNVKQVDVEVMSTRSLSDRRGDSVVSGVRVLLDLED